MKSLFIRLTFVLWAVFCSVAARAEQYGTAFRRITVDQGLSNNYVKTVCQDRSGNIWLGTNNGVNKFNGYYLKLYKHDPDEEASLQSNIINDLYADAEGAVWACTANGLSVYDVDRDVFRRVEIPGARSVENIVQLAPAVYLVSTRNFAVYYYADTGKVRNFSLDGVPVAVFSLAEKEGTLLLGTMAKTAECLFFDGQELRRKYPPVRLPYNAAAVVLAEGARAWAGFGKGGVAALDFSTGEAVLAPDVLPGSESVEAMAYDESGRLWVGSADAVHLYDAVTHRSVQLRNDPNDPLSLSYNSIKSLFRDAEGGMWVGTEFGGVNYWSGRAPKFSTFKNESGEIFLGNTVVTTLAPDEGETLWIGTRRSGLFRYSLSDGKVRSYPVDNIRALYCPDGAPELYVGTNITGWLRLQKRSGQMKRYPQPSDVNAIVSARAGMIWLGSLSGLFLYDPRTDRLVKQVFPSESGLLRVLSLFTDSRGHLWLGAKESVREYRVSEENVLEEITPASLAGVVRVNGFQETASGTLWIGTADGLFAYDREKDSLSRVKDVPGLLNTAINGIEEDAGGDLWVSTDSGLTRYSPADSSGRSYSIKDGLPGNQFSAFSCHFRDAHGRLYFGGVGGVTVLSPENITVETRTQAPVLTDLRLHAERVTPGDGTGILKKDISCTESIRLRHRQNHITLTFSCPDFVSGRQNHFAYKMDGVDKEWIPARNREAVYSNLDKGEYRFRLRVANLDGVWDPRETVLYIKVLPAWYRTLFFRILCLLALCSFLFYLEYKLYQHMQAKNKARLAGLSQEYEERLRRFRMLSFVSVPFTLKEADAELLEKVVDEIDKNLTNPQFSVASLAAGMGITRATLHKKVKAITGHSPVELVRAVRIQRACDLLKEKKYSVADVAEQTGFNSVSYFISTFKQVVGRTPGEY